MKRFLTRLLTDAISTLIGSLFRRRPRDLDEEAVQTGAIYEGVCRRVIDGDSLYISGVGQQIRLWGVDAPEVDEAGYRAATKTLKRLAHRKVLRVEEVTRDKYGRIVGRCFLDDGSEINRMMIASGTTDEYCRFTKGYYGTCD